MKLQTKHLDLLLIMLLESSLCIWIPPEKACRSMLIQGDLCCEVMFFLSSNSEVIICAFLELKQNRGLQPFSCDHHLMGTPVLHEMCWTWHTNYTQEAMHHTILQLRVNAVVIATTNWAAIFWVLWHHFEDLYTMVQVKAKIYDGLMLVASPLTIGSARSWDW